MNSIKSNSFHFLMLNRGVLWFIYSFLQLFCKNALQLYKMVV